MSDGLQRRSDNQTHPNSHYVRRGILRCTYHQFPKHLIQCSKNEATRSVKYYVVSVRRNAGPYLPRRSVLVHARLKQDLDAL